MTMDTPTNTPHTPLNKKLVSIGIVLTVIAVTVWIVGRLALVMQIYSLAGGEEARAETQQRLAFIQTALTIVDIVAFSVFLTGGALIIYAYFKGRK